LFCDPVSRERSLFSGLHVLAVLDRRVRPATRAGHGEDSKAHSREEVGATATTGDEHTVTASTSTGMPMTAASSSRRGDACQKEDRPPTADEEADGCHVRFHAGSFRRRRRRLPRQPCEGGDGAREFAHPSECSALSYVLARQIDDKIDYCRNLINARFDNSENLYRKDLLSHYGCVNAIEFSNQGDLLVSGELHSLSLRFSSERRTAVIFALSSSSIDHVIHLELGSNTDNF